MPPNRPWLALTKSIGLPGRGLCKFGNCALKRDRNSRLRWCAACRSQAGYHHRSGPLVTPAVHECSWLVNPATRRRLSRKPRWYRCQSISETGRRVGGRVVRAVSRSGTDAHAPLDSLPKLHSSSQRLSGCSRRKRPNSASPRQRCCRVSRAGQWQGVRNHDQSVKIPFDIEDNCIASNPFQTVRHVRDAVPFRMFIIGEGWPFFRCRADA